MLRLKNIIMDIQQQRILNSVSVDAYPGDFVMVTGPNGAGKSTLFDVIAGSVKPLNGTVELDGCAVTEQTEYERALRISRLFQNPTYGCALNMTVEQNCALACIKGKRASLANGFSALKKTQLLTDIEDLFESKTITKKLMSELSGGQRQLIAFLIATQRMPRVLLLDEPTAALTMQTTEYMMQLIENYTKEQAIITLMITHTIDQIHRYGNTLWVLKAGQLTSHADKLQLTREMLYAIIAS